MGAGHWRWLALGASWGAGERGGRELSSWAGQAGLQGQPIQGPKLSPAIFVDRHAGYGPVWRGHPWPALKAAPGPHGRATSEPTRGFALRTESALVEGRRMG